MGYPTSATVGRGVTSEERAQALTGERGRKEAGMKAVVEGAAAALGQIALKANAVTAAPTADDFNALREDVRNLAAVLNRMGAKFTGL